MRNTILGGRYLGAVLAAAIVCGTTGCAKRPAGAGAKRVANAAPVEKDDNTVTDPPPKAKPTESVEVTRAVGPTDARKGSRLRRQGGYLPAVLATRFYAEHQLIFLQVKQALDLYRATHGNFPKTHEDFMKHILEPNSIKLPELQDDWEYWYNGKGELMQRRIEETAPAGE